MRVWITKWTFKHNLLNQIAHVTGMVLDLLKLNVNIQSVQSTKTTTRVAKVVTSLQTKNLHKSGLIRVHGTPFWVIVCMTSVKGLEI